MWCNCKKWFKLWNVYCRWCKYSLFVNTIAYKLYIYLIIADPRNWKCFFCLCYVVHKAKTIDVSVWISVASCHGYLEDSAHDQLGPATQKKPTWNNVNTNGDRALAGMTSMCCLCKRNDWSLKSFESAAEWPAHIQGRLQNVGA